MIIRRKYGDQQAVNAEMRDENVLEHLFDVAQKLIRPAQSGILREGIFSH